MHQSLGLGRRQCPLRSHLGLCLSTCPHGSLRPHTPSRVRSDCPTRLPPPLTLYVREGSVMCDASALRFPVCLGICAPPQPLPAAPMAYPTSSLIWLTAKILCSLLQPMAFETPQVIFPLSQAQIFLALIISSKVKICCQVGSFKVTSLYLACSSPRSN